MRPVASTPAGAVNGTVPQQAGAQNLCHSGPSLRPCALRHAWGPSNVSVSRLHAQLHRRAQPAHPLVALAGNNGAVLDDAPPQAQSFPIPDKSVSRGPRVLIAGGGIGGLVLALALLKKGFDIQIFERDLTAIRGEGKYRGPIQVQSNALAALEAIDRETAEKIMGAGCITGDRVNGLCDGVTGKWYVKFDTYHPAVENGLPVTRVISRQLLQEYLAEAVRRLGGEDTILNDCHVVNFEEKVDETGRKRVWALLEDGRRFEGDLLIGADGIRSKVRKVLIGDRAANYSQYTCYTGISDFTPPDIDTVGYRVFLGNGRYFVSSDVGGGKMQWYGFHKEPAGGSDTPGRKKERLLRIFGDWTDMVTDLIKATPEEDVLRRDIYDRPPVFTWTRGLVALLGDSAHAMQPNLGQGGCMAIEDGYQLALDLSEAVERSQRAGRPVDVEAVLKGYQNKRLLRASTIHGLAGMAAIMASTYKAYLGEGLWAPLGNWLQQFKVPHPGRVGGYFAMNATMPAVLSWVLGGNTRAFRTTDRLPFCRISDKPKAFDDTEFPKFMRDDFALLRAARAHWLLVPHENAVNASVNASFSSFSEDDEADMQADESTSCLLTGDGNCERDEPTHLYGLRVALPDNAVEICPEGVHIGSDASCAITLGESGVAAQHARFAKGQDGDYYVTHVADGSKTWHNGRVLQANVPTRLAPGDELEFGSQGSRRSVRVKMVHVSVLDQLAEYYNRSGTSNGSSNGNGSGQASSREMATA
uniref:Zeaxanthin epoxidase, chloroplastic n=1 Tax=Lobosphaera incisa TaxID=312850 RepID=A0A1Y0AWU4_9CHLO|nr:chloroplast zeaxanthin epoxidase 1 [Lobosphaera incisa]